MTIDTTGKVGIGTSSPTSRLTVSSNVNALPSPGAIFNNTELHIGGADGSKARILVDAFGTGGGPRMSFRSARGTAAAPSALQTNDLLTSIGGAGYGASQYSGLTASIDFIAAENYTNSANGTGIVFNTTPVGSTAIAERVRIDPSGNVGIGTTAPSSSLDINGAYTQRGMAAPGLSSGGQGRIYFDSTDNKFKISENGGAYTDLVGAGGGGDITDVVAGTGLSGGATSGSATLNLANTAVSAGSYGSASSVGTFTVDAQGRLTAAASTPIAITADQITSAAGKYLTYAPNNVACSDQQVLKWNNASSRWECGTDSASGAAGGDLSGTYPNPTVAKLQGVAVNAAAPATGQVLSYSGTDWAPTNFSVGSLLAAAGAQQFAGSASCAASQGRCPSFS